MNDATPNGTPAPAAQQVHQVKMPPETIPAACINKDDGKHKGPLWVLALDASQTPVAAVCAFCGITVGIAGRAVPEPTREVVKLVRPDGSPLLVQTIPGGPRR